MGIPRRRLPVRCPGRASVGGGVVTLIELPALPALVEGTVANTKRTPLRRDFDNRISTLATHTQLHLRERLDLGQHYARTLRMWRVTFDANWETIRTGHLNVSQMAMSRPGEING